MPMWTTENELCAWCGKRLDDGSSFIKIVTVGDDHICPKCYKNKKRDMLKCKQLQKGAEIDG